jgi:hypothetical protein
MWSNSQELSEFKKQQERERQLQEGYLADMIEESSRLVRQDGHSSELDRKTSARAILKQFINDWKYGQITLQIQHDMVAQNLVLEETMAGRVFASQMSETRDAYEARLDRIISTLRISANAGDVKGWTQRTELEEQQKELRRLLRESTKAQKEM